MICSNTRTYLNQICEKIRKLCDFSHFKDIFRMLLNIIYQIKAQKGMISTLLNQN